MSSTELREVGNPGISGFLIFDAWGDNLAEPDDKEVIIFDHPDPDEDEAIELEIEGDVPDLASLPEDDTSVSSSGSDNTSTAYYDLDDLVDNAVDYAWN